METTITVERLENEGTNEDLPSQEILRENLKGSRKRRPRGEKQYRCKVCFEIFKEETDLILHSRTHAADKPYICLNCDYATDCRKKLTTHNKRVHEKHKYKEECKVCGKKFMFKCNLDQHMRVHTGEKPNKCDVCGKAFNSAYSLSTHKLIHTNEKPFKCAFCEYVCRDSSTLRKHQAVHLGIQKRYCCTECPKKFDTKARLTEHEDRIHRGTLPKRVECNICGHSYVSKSSLDMHIKAVHEKSLAGECGICGKHLANMRNLGSHMRTHLDIRPYKCEQCVLRFKEKGDLKKHIRKVHRPKQVICDYCGKKCKDKKKLVAHILVHAPRVKKTECPLCSVYFVNKNYLLKHLRYKHGKREKFICDLCGFESFNKPGLVTHLKHKHTTLDTQCHICRKIFKRKVNLYYHYSRKHNITFKSNEDESPPMVVIKEEPLDFAPDLEIDLLDIDKEEPFAGFDVDPERVEKLPMPRSLSDTLNSSVEDAAEICNGFDVDPEKVEKPRSPMPRSLSDTLNSSVEEATEICNDKQNTTVEVDCKEDNNLSESDSVQETKVDEFVHQTVTDTTGSKEIPSAQDAKKDDLPMQPDDLQPESGHKPMEVDEFIHKIIAETADKAIEEPTSSKEKPTQAEPGRPTMQVEEFLQHVMGDTNIQMQEDEESEEYQKIKVKELIEQSNINNGVRKRQNWYGHKVEKIEVDDISKFLPMPMYKDVIPKEEEKEKSIEKVKKKKKRKKPKRNKGEKKEYKVKKNSLAALIKGNKKRQYSKKSKKKTSENNEDSDESKKETARKKRKKEEETAKKRDSIINSNPALKVIFNSHQCYVCLMLFQTKPELIEHCKQHFDVCNDITLKKCPFCPFVTHHNIRRHMRLMHKESIKYSFMRIKDKKDNKDGSRYYFDTDNDKIKRLEIIPSVKMLNKKASMNLDKKKRELKDKSLLKRKLVRKGKEWIVEHEKIDVSEHVVPVLKNKDDYLAKMKLLGKKSKQNKTKMLYPCNSCDKICQNLSALTLHLRRHDPNPKPFAPRKRRNRRIVDINEKIELPQNIASDISNRTADPQPIKHNHKCDPKLKKFYENNIKGGDIEFWQFLKIFNKMDRENINDFKDVENNSYYFGVHSNTNNNENEATTSNTVAGNTDSETNTVEAGNTENKTVKTKSIANRTVKKIKYVRKIQLSREEYKKRCELKNKLREKLANANS